MVKWYKVQHQNTMAWYHGILYQKAPWYFGVVHFTMVQRTTVYYSIPWHSIQGAAKKVAP